NVAAEPGGLPAPVHVLIRLPRIRTPAGEAERFKAHRLEGDIAREDHQIGPRNLPSILLLDRPEEPARLIETDIVGPTVQRCEALLTASTAAAAITGAIGAGAVPGHADEERSVVAKVCRPPLLRVRHQRGEILLQGCVIERLELLCVVEVGAH